MVLDHYYTYFGGPDSVIGVPGARYSEGEEDEEEEEEEETKSEDEHEDKDGAHPSGSNIQDVVCCLRSVVPTCAHRSGCPMGEGKSRKNHISTPYSTVADASRIGLHLE